MAKESIDPKYPNEFQRDLINSFLDSDFNSPSYRGVPDDYIRSPLRKQRYTDTPKEDDTFAEYVKQKFGSIENFFLFNEQLRNERIYDPLNDYDIEVEIITSEQFLKSNFISSSEMFMEILGGVCTVQYFKKNGNAAQIVTTLKKSLIPSSEHSTRESAFRFFGDKRVLVWDLTKQGWSSFYMSNVRRFVRDDTSGLQ